MNETNQPQEPTNTGGAFFTSDALRAILGQPPFSDAIKQLGYTPPAADSRRPSNLELPYGMTLSRFASKRRIELIGKYRVADYDLEPSRVCRILIDKELRRAAIDINGDEKVVLEAACGNCSMLQYVAVKALKGYLQYRMAHNTHCSNRKKRRRAEKRAKAAALKSETTTL